MPKAFIRHETDDICKFSGARRCGDVNGSVRFREKPNGRSYGPSHSTPIFFASVRIMVGPPMGFVRRSERDRPLVKRALIRRNHAHGFRERPNPAVVYTDASGEGHIGFVVFVDEILRMAHTRIPGWMSSLLPGISEYDLRANSPGPAMATELAPGRSVVRFCDNMGAAGAVIRGARRSKLRALLSVFLRHGGRFRHFRMSRICGIATQLRGRRIAAMLDVGRGFTRVRFRNQRGIPAPVKTRVLGEALALQRPV